MLREALDDRSAPVVDDFRHRGHHHVSRIESFSDAVFGFSLTLLVVSLEVPRSFTELMRTISGFPAFAITFALLAQIWYLQYRFFRRYAMEDSVTITLNVMLLFVIVFFTYPLKFMFGAVFTGTELAPQDVVPLFAVYDGGYAAVFAIFGLLHANALHRRKALALSPLEAFDTVTVLWRDGSQIAVAALSLGLTAYFSTRGAHSAAALAGGFAYFTVPLSATALGFWRGAKRRRYKALGVEH